MEAGHGCAPPLRSSWSSGWLCRVPSCGSFRQFNCNILFESICIANHGQHIGDIGAKSLKEKRLPEDFLKNSQLFKLNLLQWALSIIGQQRKICFIVRYAFAFFNTWTDDVRFLSTMNMSFLRQLVESQAHTKLASLVHGKVFFDLPLEQHHCVVFNHYTDSYSWLSGRIWICYCSTMRNPCS